jgi:hypothetical protein
MKITAMDAHVGATASWDAMQIQNDQKKIFYMLSFGNLLDSKMRYGGSPEYGRKISYYTPKIKGFQFGISYIPDGSNLGSGKFDKRYHYDLNRNSPYKLAVSNALGYGLSWEGKISEIALNTSIAYEQGKTKTEKQLNDKAINFKNLNAYTLGGKIAYDKYTFAASYGNHLRSFTSPLYDKLSRDTYLYSLGTKYKYSKTLSSSFHYFFSNHKASKFRSLTASLNYTPISGLETFIEATRYYCNGKSIVQDAIVKENIKGNLFVLGGRIAF